MKDHSRSDQNTILVFEHDEAEVRLTKEALERHGFLVDCCRTGQDGLAGLAQKAYAAYVIDVHLPDLPWAELLKRLTALKPEAVSIVVGDQADEAGALEAIKLGASDYVNRVPDHGHLAMLPLVISESLERGHLKGERSRLHVELWEYIRILEERTAELQKANEELKRVAQLKSDLVSMVSHELRTPLATIKEFTAILADRLAGPLTDDQATHLATITTNVERLERMIDELLDMAKIESGRVLLDSRMIALEPLLTHVLQSMRPLADSKRITLEAVLPPESSEVLADADKITQVLLNLVSNAIKFTPGPGRVTIRVDAQAEEVRCSVTDTGVGIAPEDLPKLFEQFIQLRRLPGLRGQTGTGLGLAISKRLVELHGGRIWATSIEGTGSTFTFSLPKYRAEQVFRDRLKASVERAKRAQARCSIVLVRPRHLQEFTTRYGTKEVHALLKELEQTVREALPSGGGDVAMRWPRGELAVILQGKERAAAQALAAHLTRMAGDDKTLTVAGQPLAVHLVTSAATYPDDASTEEALLKVAEERLLRTGAHRTRILAVDDDPRICELMKELMTSRGYEVFTAANGPEALERLATQTVDLILLDLIMPRMDGYEVYHLLKENPRTKEIPVIIVTGLGERKDRQLGLDTATYNYLTKPFQVEDLVTKVREVLLQQS